jgi:diaminopimelate epimerase
MSSLTLTKHHGLGNDFLVVFEPEVVDLAALARKLCDRRRGIGADGLLVGTPAPIGSGDGAASASQPAATMVLYNADGSRAEMSGNGIRCFAQAISRRSGGSLAPITVYTDAGVRRVELAANGAVDTILATVDMGPVAALDEPADWHALGCNPHRPVMHLSLGNPHSVVGVEDVNDVDLARLGGQVPHVNLEIVQPGASPSEIRMRVHERGAGITEACGTGACAAAHAAAKWGLATPSNGKLTVHMDGGSATVVLDAPVLGHVTLTGPATYVGTIVIEDVSTL